MVANERAQSRSLSYLQQEGEEFNFFQAARLLENLTEVNGELRFKGNNTQAFMPNFVAGVRSHVHRKKTKITLITNSFTLAGQQGPIPHCFSEMLQRAETSEQKYQEQPQGFLDIFNHRLIQLLYQVKKQFDPLLFNRIGSEHPLYNLFCSIGGLRFLQLFQHSPVLVEQLAAFATILANRRGDYSLLKNILGQYFQSQIQITPNQGAWRQLPKKFQARLSHQPQADNSNHLGQGMGLGSKYWDNQAGIRIDIKVKDIQEYQALQPGAELYLILKALATLATDGKYLLYIFLHIEASKIPKSHCYSAQTSIRDKHSLRLGQTSWLMSADKPKPHTEQRAFIIYPDLKHNFVQECEE